MSEATVGVGRGPAVRVSMRLDGAIYAVLTEVGRRRGYEVVDYIQKILRDYVATANEVAREILPETEKIRLRLESELIQWVIDKARELVRAGQFTPDLTLTVFQLGMKDKDFSEKYIRYVGDNPYKHGNPRKGINKELGWRIKNCIEADVMKDENGDAVKRTVKGEVIQSYTRLATPNMQ